MTRLVRIACSLARFSFVESARDFPTACIFSSYSTLNGKKSMPSRGFLRCGCCRKNYSIAIMHKCCAVCLFCYTAYVYGQVLPASSIEKLLYINNLLFLLSRISKQLKSTPEYGQDAANVFAVSDRPCTSRTCHWQLFTDAM